MHVTLKVFFFFFKQSSMSPFHSSITLVLTRVPCPPPLHFGEEQTYMSVWAMTFLVNTFGVEALQQVSRKALFMYVMQRANGLMKTRWGGFGSS